VTSAGSQAVLHDRSGWTAGRGGGRQDVGPRGGSSGIGAEPNLQRNLPTGGVEPHCPIGSPPRLVGPLTRARVEVLASATTVVAAIG
jgi:hypothetical protein